MSNGAICFSEEVEYYTPKYIVDKFGSFDFDPATTAERAKVLNIPNYADEKIDGLSVDWSEYKKIWLNPPFTMKKEFLKKAVDTYKKTGNEIYVLFPISFLTTRAFHSLVGGGESIYSECQNKIREQSGGTALPCLRIGYYKAARYLGANTTGDLDGKDT